ncbi:MULTISPECIES: biotin/lipoyl-containing protein [unclassified Oscillibacter]|uniref:biotin/lipoyl-containing protein n=1 Tax=unclassified Oscillibacter TaxID=2629304 RepID=UPI0025EA4F7A|nr:MULTISPECIES: biotin/lipoyl-containing protein [unclassified Oscillibacter]
MRAYTITVNGKAYDVQVAENDASASAAAPRIQSVTPAAAPAPTAAPAPVAAPAAAPAAPVAAGEGTVTAPMAGKVLSVPVKAGDAVAAGQVLLTFEAMKMENEIMAPCAGTVAQVFIKIGEQFDAGAQLVQLG